REGIGGIRRGSSARAGARVACVEDAEEWGEEEEGAAVRVLRHEWRVLRFNESTRQSVARVATAAVDVTVKGESDVTIGGKGEGERRRVILQRQQPDCLAFECASASQKRERGGVLYCSDNNQTASLANTASGCQQRPSLALPHSPSSPTQLLPQTPPLSPIALASPLSPCPHGLDLKCMAAAGGPHQLLPQHFSCPLPPFLSPALLLSPPPIPLSSTSLVPSPHSSLQHFSCPLPPFLSPALLCTPPLLSPPNPFALAFSTPCPHSADLKCMAAAAALTSTFPSSLHTSSALLSHF
ncbi:unnamed protein product, partial [Closterium sp. NIES-65]